MITLPHIEGKTFAVLGLGKSGLSTAASLLASNAKVLLWDDSEDMRGEAEKAGLVLTDFTEADLAAVQALILSPGIPFTHPSPHPLVVRCRAAGIEVIGDIELLFRACPNATYVAVTGTNGKSTTTALIGHVLQAAGRNVQVGGNLGTPALTLDSLGEDGIYVLELSSYQLDLIKTNPIKVAVLLNITPDHLDRHGGFKGYIASKARLFTLATAPQTLVLGTDDEPTRALLEMARGQKNLSVQEISVLHPVTQGVMAAGQQMFAYDNEEGRPIVAFPLLPTLPGNHNWQNACAAFAACHALGVPDKQVTAGLKSFPGLAHRQQFIAEVGGIRFINDSKATNADAASKALACYKTIYWILGGKPKEGGLKGLEPFAPRIRHAFIIGQASEEFAAWCEGKVSFTRCGTLDVAVEKAAAMAWQEKVPNAVVLLSPACASWDQFKSFEARGDLFAKLVRALDAPHQQAKVM